MFPRCVWMVVVCLAGLGWMVQPRVATAQAVSSGDTVAGASAESQAITIGLDIRHAHPYEPYGLNLSNFSEFRDSISGLGYTYVVKDSFTGSDLNGLDALVLYQPYTADPDPGFTAEEISAIQAFVQGGGGLFVIADAGGGDPNLEGLNQIVNPYGIGYSEGMTTYGATISMFWYHPLTRGVHTVGVYFGYSMWIVPPALDLTVENEADPYANVNILAAREGIGGAGNIVCVGDASTFANYGSGTSLFEYDNRILLQNVLRFIVGQNPYDCSSPIPADFFRSVFESSNECWEPVSVVPSYVAPAFSREDGAIGLSPDGSALAFGYWNSPVLSVEPGEAYAVAWVVRSTTTPDLCPQFRLRINDVLGRDAVYRAVESRMAGENSPGTSEVWYGILYDVPDSVSEITVSFDLLSFDGTDDLSSTVQLREVMVFPYSYLLTLEPAAQVQWLK